MKTLMLCLFLGLIMLFASVALGGETSSTRCGVYVIQPGDSVVTVFQKCGQPNHKVGNVWFYDHGPGEPIKIFHMENEAVNSIEEVARE